MERGAWRITVHGVERVRHNYPGTTYCLEMRADSLSSNGEVSLLSTSTSSHIIESDRKTEIK